MRSPKLLGRNADDIRQTLRSAREQLLAAREKRQTPYVDTTIYTSWNAMFISAYLDAAQTLDDARAATCRTFALRTLDRLLAEGWDDQRGFAHRLGGERLDGTLDDQVFMAAALLDGFEATLDRRYFDAAERAMKLVAEKYDDEVGDGFFDRASDAAPLGGLDVRRKPMQDSPTPGGNPVAAIVLDRLYAYTGDSAYREDAEAVLEAFAGIAVQYALFASTYGLAALLHARQPLQVVVTGRGDDENALRLERAARQVFRYGKAVLRLTPEGPAADSLPSALRETLPHLQADQAEAFVCAGGTCYPPVSDPGKLAELLAQVGGGLGAAAV